MVCYDLEGRRQWYRPLGDGHRVAGDRFYPRYVYSSPALVDGRLVGGIRQALLPRREGRAVLWTGKLHHQLCFSSPIPGKIGKTWYIGTGDCQVYRLRDGRLIGDHGPIHNGVSSMIFHDGGFNRMGFFIELPTCENGVSRVRWKLDMASFYRGMTGKEPRRGYSVWGHHGQPRCSVYDRGVFYHQNEGGSLARLDARTGKFLKAGGRLRNCGPYTGLVIAGNYLIAGGDITHVLELPSMKPIAQCEAGTGKGATGTHWFFHG